VRLPVKNKEGEVVGEVDVSDVLFAAPANPALVHQALVAQQANRRVGTHSTKTRGEVSGGGRKPRPQKYTGRSRQGSIRSPLWQGGGVAHGPRPRSYRQALPKTMRRLALRSALSSRVAAEEVVLLDTFGLEKPKTQEMRRVLDNLGANRSALIIVGEPDGTVSLSARNLPKVQVLPAYRLNVEDVLRYHRVVMTVDAARRAEELWARPLTKREREARSTAA